MRAALDAALAGGADAIEVRLDCLAEPPTAAQLAELLRGVETEIIVTNRSAAQGGNFHGTSADRQAVLQRVAGVSPAVCIPQDRPLEDIQSLPSDAGKMSAGHEGGTPSSRTAPSLRVFIDVEVETPSAAPHHGRTKIILSQHHFAGPLADPAAVMAEMKRTPADVHKLAFMAAGPEDALAALDLLHAADSPTIALAMGEHGVASRILAKKFGAFGTFAAVKKGSESAPGQPTLDEFRRLYRWDRIGPATTVFGVIGCPVTHSMSPAIHNAAFDATGLDAVYVPLRVEPAAEHFNRLMDALQARPWLDWRGLSVTLPHKEHALAYVGAANCDELAVRIGAINTITIGPDGSLRGDNTDYAAILDALCEGMGISRAGLAGRRVAVLGAGGVARAIVAAATHYGADVTVLNRTPERAARLAEEFACRHAPWADAEKIDAEILINGTPIGMHPNVNDSPLENIPPAVRVVFDTIYNPIETALLKQAVRRGCTVITGLDMFVHQAAKQFERWTNQPAPRDVMRTTILQRLGGV
ncbi:MAG: shikimate dehydrogenase [Phycisphaerae bacterium]|nr:shikimate dehydrogenase [Phycisphaerae bacterium]